MNINDSLNDIGKKSLIASNQVKNFTSEEKNNLLMKIAEKINLDKELILIANKKVARAILSPDMKVIQPETDKYKIEKINAKILFLIKIINPKKPKIKNFAIYDPGTISRNGPESLP